MKNKKKFLIVFGNTLIHSIILRSGTCTAILLTNPYDTLKRYKLKSPQIPAVSPQVKVV